MTSWILQQNIWRSRTMLNNLFRPALKIWGHLQYIYSQRWTNVSCLTWRASIRCQQQCLIHVNIFLRCLHLWKAKWNSTGEMPQNHRHMQAVPEPLLLLPGGQSLTIPVQWVAQARSRVHPVRLKSQFSLRHHQWFIALPRRRNFACTKSRSAIDHIRRQRQILWWVWRMPAFQLYGRAYAQIWT